MAEYSIRELERFSGIKAHTIRIWEKRYKLIKPKRTNSNVRLYSDNDLKKIINVAIVNNAGVKISHIAVLSQDQLTDLVNKHTRAGKPIASAVDKLLLATVEMNEKSLAKELQKLEASRGFERTVTGVIYPFLEQIGVLWQTGKITPAQEHFVSNLIRQKMFAAIDKLPLPSPKSPKVVLFLREGEFHEMGLLFYHYMARKLGNVSYYLGQSVPHNDLKKVVEVHRPKYLITSLVAPLNDKELGAFLKELTQDFPSQSIIISGMAAKNFDFSRFPMIKRISSAIDLKNLL